METRKKSQRISAFLSALAIAVIINFTGIELSPMMTDIINYICVAIAGIATPWFGGDEPPEAKEAE